MFSERTKDLAKQLMFVQKQLDESIREDTDGRACLCERENLQLYLHDKSHEAVSAVVPEGEREPLCSATDILHFKIGEVPAVAVVDKLQ